MVAEPVLRMCVCVFRPEAVKGGRSRGALAPDSSWQTTRERCTHTHTSYTCYKIPIILLVCEFLTS